MKTTTSLLLAGAVVLGFALTTEADEPFLSPRAGALRGDLRKVPVALVSPNLVSSIYPGAAIRLEQNRARVVPTGRGTPNLISGNYAGAAAKNPGAGTIRFEIAPLAKAATTCDMACCVKN